MAVSACSGFSDSLTITVGLLQKPKPESKGGAAVKVRRKEKSTFVWIMLVILLICAAASLTVLFSRMSSFSGEMFRNVIPLTRSGGDTKVTVLTAGATPASSAGDKTTSQSGAASFKAYDENTVWQSETEVEIFRLSYQNGSGELTVKSSNGDELIAPGTSNEYVFTLENTGNVALDYNMTMEAWIEGTNLHIPVKARVWDYTNKYLLGSQSQSRDILELNNVSDESVLGSGRSAVYTLEWEWPFEQGADGYDTMLGNLAADSDLTLNIRINTLAVYDETPDDPKVSGAGLSSPKTGDDMPVVPLAAGLAAAIFIAVSCCFAKRKQNEG